MSDGLKSKLRLAIDEADAFGRYTDPQIDCIHELIDELAAQTPMPRPIDEQEKVTSPWKTLFSQFGGKHLAGKPIVHETSFATISFNNFPDVALRNLDIVQEIHHETKDFNNVAIVENLDSTLQSIFTMYGRYRIEPDNPKRYIASFYRVALAALGDVSDDEVRAAFSMSAEQPLSVDIKPPKLHSDVVYCDDQLRVNVGSMGGVFVMERDVHEGYSVSFS